MMTLAFIIFSRIKIIILSIVFVNIYFADVNNFDLIDMYIYAIIYFNPLPAIKHTVLISIITADYHRTMTYIYYSPLEI